MSEANTQDSAAQAEEKKGSSRLMAQAMEAFGIRPKHVLSSKDYDDHVVIVTKGGSKVSFAPGDKVKQITGTALDGQMPPEVRAKKEAAKAKKKS